MNQSFSATIHFALLALAMLFLANLAGAVFLPGNAFVWGVLAAIAGAGLSYGSQHFFTEAAGWLAHYQQTSAPDYAGPVHPDAFQKHQDAQQTGSVLQLVAVAMAGFSGVLFAWGAL